MNNDNNELNYLLKFSYYYIVDFLDSVLDDSEDDPEYSAVTLCNLIYCYEKVRHPTEVDDSNAVIKRFLSEHGYSDEIYSIIEQKRKIESAYYIGEQFVGQ